eukprot:CAMPEP_0117077830 /NCGR_PEP_ID=MMETSP0472-20121206/54864_1 /TAXON_ID=693140 ORGANISM="Tiarina fusus, Strain LIS" /NCGR_SAMPLE_ID=MMETSP0472 /ASSEMBLY_ACC=CAM_ASM_000603 /LENGTH=388 /DNA_ID=CAMNT_0004804299 /DNA_START=245 /DNA_END=1407 /DNA_ORIENTATION=+
MSVQEEEDQYSVQIGESSNNDINYNNNNGGDINNHNNSSRNSNKDAFYDDEDDVPYPEHVPKDVSMGDFFHTVMNNGAGDNVICFKMIVFLILIMAALIIGNAAFIFTTEEINTDFLTEFDSYASDVVILAQDRVSVLFEFTISLRDHVIGQCIETQNCPWPFVTLTSFEERHHRFVEQERVNEVALIPLVTHDDREEWERYSVEHQGWVQDGINFRYGHNDSNSNSSNGGGGGDSIPTGGPIPSYLHNGVGKVDDKVPAPQRDVYAAVWQLAPAPPNPSRVNFDAFLDDTFRSSYVWINETRHPLLSQVLRFDPARGAEPQALLLEPMGETFDQDSKMVGIFSTLITWSTTLITWSTFFKTSIPPSRDEIILVLEDTCGGGEGGAAG